MHEHGNGHDHDVPDIPSFLQSDPATAGKPMGADHPIHLAALSGRREKEKEKRARERTANKERERAAAERQRQVDQWKAEGKHYDPRLKAWVW